jgi:hypothetical protein
MVEMYEPKGKDRKVMSNNLQIIRDDIYSTRERFDKMSGGA